MLDELREAPTTYAMIESFFRDEFATENELITEAVRRMLRAGGKRLRPRMTLLAAQAVGSDPRRHLMLAAYMELIHVATLIHDDVVDNAQTRRGVNATAVDFGNRVSVLAGDYLFAWIFKNVTETYAHPIPNILAATLAEICDGEVLQLRALADPRVGLERYVEIASKKTASLFCASAACGALDGGASSETVRAFQKFARAYGVAFQISDDLLDVTGTAQTGKERGNDLRERKMTAPVIFALESGDVGVRDRIERFLRDGEDDEIPHIVAAMESAGAFARTRAEIARFAREATRSLEAIPSSAATAELCDLAIALTEEP